jgi:hypothetical protein
VTRPPISLPDADASLPAGQAAPPAALRIELMVLALLAPALVVTFAEPALVRELLPALTLVPVLFGVRYGFIMGLGSALLVSGLMLGMHLTVPPLAVFSKVHMAVTLLAGCLAGHFRDQWSRALRDAGAEAQRYQARLARFTTSYHLLQASHAQLEHQLAESPPSLRATLQELKTRFPSTGAGSAATIAGIAPDVLALLAQCGNLHGAGLHLADADGGIDTSALAVIGTPAPLSPHDPLLRNAIENGATASLDAAHSQAGRLIAVVPLIDSAGRLHAVVAIHQMAFFAVHWRTFDLLGIVARQVADLLSERLDIHANAASAEARQACIERGLDHARMERMRLAIVVLKVNANDASRGAALVARCLSASRSIDQAWQETDASGAPVVVKLLPVPDEQGANLVMARLRRQLHEDAHNTGAGDIEQLALFLAPAHQSASDLLQRIHELTGRPIGFTASRGIRKHGALEVVR